MRRKRARSGRARGTPRRCRWRTVPRSRLARRRARCRGRPRCRPHMRVLGRRPGSAPGLGAPQCTHMAQAGTQWRSIYMACLCAARARVRRAAAGELTRAAACAGAGSAWRSRVATGGRASARAGHHPAPAAPAPPAAAAAAARPLRSARGATGAPDVLAAAM